MICYGNNRPEKVLDFLREVDEVCKKYGFCIGHEDGGGAFVIVNSEEYDDDNGWFTSACYKGTLECEE